MENNQKKKKKELNDQNVKEVSIVNENNCIKKDVGKHKNLLVIIIAILLVVILVTLIFFCIKDGDYSFIYNKDETNKNEIELKYTENTTVKSDGVYITDVSEVVDEVMPSIVAITSKTIINSGRLEYGYDNKYTSVGAGSGVIIADSDEEIFILTNYHVVDNTSLLSVQFIDNESYDAKVKGISERKDIAIVSVSKKNVKKETLEKIKIATIGNSDELNVGNGIIAIGNALGYGQSVTTGVVSALNREVATDDYIQNMIQIDAAINGGNSGGALINAKGEVVGINTAKYSSNLNSIVSIEGMGFAIPISNVISIVEDLINGKNDNYLTLGIEGYMTNSGNIASYGLPKGFYISSINKDGNAASSDLEIGYIITYIDNQEVTSIDVIKKVLNNKEKGDSIILKVKYPSKKEYLEKEIIVILD